MVNVRRTLRNFNFICYTAVCTSSCHSGKCKQCRWHIRNKNWETANAVTQPRPLYRNQNEGATSLCQLVHRNTETEHEVRNEVNKEWNGRKEMFYLTTHSTHFIAWLYGIGHMVKDHSDSERRNPLPPHGLLFPINSKGSFICTIPQTG